MLSFWIYPLFFILETPQITCKYTWRDNQGVKMGPNKGITFCKTVFYFFYSLYFILRFHVSCEWIDLHPIRKASNPHHSQKWIKKTWNLKSKHFNLFSICSFKSLRICSQILSPNISMWTLQFVKVKLANRKRQLDKIPANLVFSI